MPRSAQQSTGFAYDWDQERLNRIRTAQAQSELARARLQGMKIRSEMEPPRAASGGFPYPARTCAEWSPYIDWFERVHRGRL
jgi:hypothetical protein